MSFHKKETEKIDLVDRPAEDTEPLELLDTLEETSPQTFGLKSPFRALDALSVETSHFPKYKRSARPLTASQSAPSRMKT